MKIRSSKDPQEKLSNILLRYRILNGLTQVMMSRLLKCTQSQYSIWEKGGIPNKLREDKIREIIK